MLGNGVLQTVSEINSSDVSSDTHLQLCQLHTLLHLELLWVLGETVVFYDKKCLIIVKSMNDLSEKEVEYCTEVVMKYEFFHQK